MLQRKVVLACFVAAIGAFMFGLDVGYIGSVLEAKEFKRDVAHLPDWEDPHAQISSYVSGQIVATFSFGCMVACFPPCSSYFIDVWGLNMSMTIGASLILIGAILQTSAYSVAHMMTGRFIAGFAVGLLSTATPLYQSDLAPPDLRGSLTAVYQLMVTFGIFAATALGFLTKLANGWRLATGFQIVPAVTMLICLEFLPHSPRWLVRMNRTEEAETELMDLRPDPLEAQTEMEDIVLQDEINKTMGDPLWSELFQSRVRKYAALGFTLKMLEQLSGINAFMYFGPNIFAIANLDPVLFQTIMGGVNFIATIPAIFLVDKCGRKFLLVLGSIGMSIACLGMGVVGKLCLTRSKENPDELISSSQLGSMVIMTCVCLFVVSFAMTWGPVCFVYIAEIFPGKHRPRLVALAMTCNWVGNYIIARFTPVLLARIGFNTFFVFFIFCLLGLLLTSWLPETKGVRLERIDDLFDPWFGEDEERAKRRAQCRAGAKLRWRKLYGTFSAVKTVQKSIGLSFSSTDSTPRSPRSMLRSPLTSSRDSTPLDTVRSSLGGTV